VTSIETALWSDKNIYNALNRKLIQIQFTGARSEADAAVLFTSILGSGHGSLRKGGVTPTTGLVHDLVLSTFTAR
jgi:hypothetical protein